MSKEKAPEVVEELAFDPKEATVVVKVRRGSNSANRIEVVATHGEFVRSWTGALSQIDENDFINQFGVDTLPVASDPV